MAKYPLFRGHKAKCVPAPSNKGVTADLDTDVHLLDSLIVNKKNCCAHLISLPKVTVLVDL